MYLQWGVKEQKARATREQAVQPWCGKVAQAV
jgi:hypothetical protein